LDVPLPEKAAKVVEGAEKLKVKPRKREQKQRNKFM
jgi:hypothetical protein